MQAAYGGRSPARRINDDATVLPGPAPEAACGRGTRSSAGIPGVAASVRFRQCTSLVHGDVVGLVTSDRILWIAFGAVTHVAFEFHILRVLFDDHAFNVSGFGIPSDVVSNGELLRHTNFLSH